MSRRMIVVAALACCVGGFAEGAAPPPPSSNRASQMQPPGVPATSPAVKPDLIVEKIWVTGTSAQPGGTRVDVRYWIANTKNVDSWKFPTKAGKEFWDTHPSAIQIIYSFVDMRVLPNGSFPVVKGADCPIMLGANARWDQCYGSVLVPTGKRAEIRATVDSLNYVNESDETNNSKSLIWPPITAKPLPR